MRRTLLAALVLVLAGCGGGDKHIPIGQRQAPRSALAKQCPANHGTMGCALQRPTGLTKLGAVVAGPKIPDVSSYQGFPNWPLAKPHIAGALVKAGEYVRDPSFYYNASSLNHLGMWWAPYWFVRGYNCVQQAQLFVSIAWSLRPPGPFILDAEVPAANGQVPCMAGEIKRLTGWSVVGEYTAAGSDPGGGHADLLWDAAWGLNPGCVWTCNIAAWQFTGDGHGPLPHALPGIPGNGIDISLDKGITRYRLKPPGPTPQQVTSWTRARDSSYGAFAARHCTAHLARSDCFTFGIRRVVFFQARLNATRTRPHCFGTSAQPNATVCRVLRPYVARWSHARDATRRALNTHRCRPGGRGLCGRLAQRELYYQHQINANLY